MNYVGTFEAKVPADDVGLHFKGHVETVHATHVPPDAIIVPDAHLLFRGDYKRSGVDLILSKDDRELVLHDYFKGEKRAALSSPDGAHLNGDVVSALTGHVQYAQADGSASVGKIIGHVTKLAGSATAMRNGVVISLNLGDNVEKGDVVQSGSNSKLGISFIDGTVFAMSSDARMVLNEMVYDPNGSNNSSLLSLVAGTISFVAGDTAKHGDMKVDTPVATMGIRGTAIVSYIDIHIPLPPLDPNAAPFDSALTHPSGSFQVVVEPDGSLGSAFLYDPQTLTPFAELKHENEQINISERRVYISNDPLSPDRKDLIDEMFTLRFTDNSNTKTTVVMNDSIVPNDGRLGFHLPDGSIYFPVFALGDKSLTTTNNSPNTPTTFLFPLHVTLDQTTAKEGTPIHTTGGGATSFDWQVSIDKGQSWTTVGTDPTYTPTEIDEGKLLQLVVNNASQSDTFSLGAVAEDPAEKASISLAGLTSGHAVEGTLVTAKVTDLDAPASSNITYTWLVDGLTKASGLGLNTYTPTDSDEDKVVTVSVSFTDIHGNLETGTVSAGTVAPLAEPPNLSVTATHGAEGGLIALNIVASGHDTDDSVTVNISGVPSGATLTDSGGNPYTANKDGSYTLTPDQLTGLHLDAAKLEEGTVTLHVVATNNATGEVASVNTDLTLTVDPVADNPVLSGVPSGTVHVAEGNTLDLSGISATADGSDPVSITISGIPSDAFLTDTAHGSTHLAVSGGSITFTAAQIAAGALTGLTLTAGEETTGTVTVTANNTEPGETAGTSQASFTLTVDPVADNPVLSGVPSGTVHVAEGNTLDLSGISATADGSDPVSITISGIPSDAFLTDTAHGSTHLAVSGGSITFTAAQIAAGALTGLTLTAGEETTGTVTVTANNTETGETAGTSQASFTLTVDPVADNPVLSGVPSGTVHVAEGNTLDLSGISATADGSDPVSITISGIPSDAFLTDTAHGSTHLAVSGGSITFTAAQIAAGALTGLTLTAGEETTGTVTVTANNTEPGETAGVSSASFTLTVDPVADNPVLSGVPSGTVHVAEGNTLDLSGISATADGSDPVSITISGIPSDAFLTDTAHGSTHLAVSGGSITFTAAQIAAGALTGLTLTAGEETTGTVTVTANNTEPGETAGVSSASFTLTVDPVADNPVLSGVPSGTVHVAEGNTLDLSGISATADGSDPVSITISGIPSDAFLTDTAHGSTHLAVSGGSITFTAAQIAAGALTGLTLTAGEETTGTVTVTANNTEPGETAGVSSASFTLTVDPVADNPVLSGVPSGTVHVAEGNTLDLSGISATADGSDPVSITISGIPSDAFLTDTAHGSTHLAVSGGSITFTAAQIAAGALTGLTLTAGEETTGTVTVTANNTEPGETAGVSSASFTLTVDPVADNPVLSGVPSGTVHVAEGNTLDLSGISATADGSDPVSITISGIPSDAFLTDTAHGSTHLAVSGGSITFTAAQIAAGALTGLTLTAGEETTGTVTVTANNTEPGETAGVSSASFTLTVDPVADNPVLSGVPSGTVHVAEGNTLDLSGISATADGSDPVSITISGIPSDAFLTDTAHGSTHLAVSGGSITFTAAQIAAGALTGLTLTAGEETTGTVTVTANNTEPGETAGVSSASFTLTVDPVADNPVLSGVPSGTVHVAEGNTLDLSGISATADGSDPVSITISGIPSDAFLTDTAHGSTHLAVSGGSITFTAAQIAAGALTGLTLTAGEETTGTVTVTANNTEPGETAGVSSASFTLTVDPVAEPASLAGTVTSVSGTHDTGVPLTIVATPFDSDDSLSITISGIPSDAFLTDTNGGSRHLAVSGGSITFTAAQIAAGALNGLRYDADEGSAVLHVVVTSSEGSSSVASSVDIAVSIDSSLTIAAGNTLHINGDTLTDHFVTVDGTLIGFGTVTGSGGTLDNITIGPSGLIEASSSHSLDLNGNITGSGTLELTNNTTMEIGGSVESSLHVLFAISAGATGKLIIDDPADFNAPITGFGGTDVIDLHNNHFAYLGTGTTLLNSSHPTATLVSGTSTETIGLVSMTSTETVITVSEGGTTATIDLEGNYTGHSFTFSSDGSGGTQFVDPLAIYSGNTVELQGASTDNVLFVNNAEISGTLVLDNATAFTGQISGFTGTSAQSDAIDLKGTTFDSETTWTYTENAAGTGGALTISEGATVVDTLNFSGNYTTANFTVQSDSNGGTLITDPPTSSPVVNSVIMHDPGPAASTIVATAPNQTLTGLGTSDTFVFNFAAVGHTTLADFHPDFDSLQFKSPIFASALAALNAAQDDGHGNTVIAIDAQDSITLNGVVKAQLQVADFHVV